MNITIDHQSGFCFGVKKAIDAAENSLRQRNQVFCLGDIVHNEQEVERLEKLGLRIINQQELNGMNHKTVLFRAHGEPPASYETTSKLGINLIDATCPVVLKLQQRIKKAWELQRKQNGQIVIFGKKGHAEVTGLQGQTNFECIVIENLTDTHQLDYKRPMEIFAQTTKDPETFRLIVEQIKEKAFDPNLVIAHNTTCKQVSGRAERLATFALQHNIIIFVGGRKSSNSKILFDICKNINPKSYFVTEPSEIQRSWFEGQVESIGIFGATSTPMWLMEKIAEEIENLNT